MNWQKFFVAMIACAAIMVVVHTVGAIADMQYYTNPLYFALWSKVMMPNGGAPGVEFQVTSIVFDIIIGAIFAYAFYLVKGLHGNDPNRVGLNYGVFLFALTTVPGTLSMYLLFALPLALLASWLVQGLVIAIACGLAIAHVEAR